MNGCGALLRRTRRILLTFPTPTRRLVGLALLASLTACSREWCTPADALAALARHASGEWVLAPESRATVPGAPADVSPLSISIDAGSITRGGWLSCEVSARGRIAFDGAAHEVTLCDAGALQAEALPTELQPDGTLGYGPGQPLGTEYSCLIALAGADGSSTSWCLKWEPPVDTPRGANFKPRRECLKLSFTVPTPVEHGHVPVPAEPCLVYVRVR
jgi:hypothetical protein